MVGNVVPQPAHRAWLLEKLFWLHLVAARDFPMFFVLFLVVSRISSGKKPFREQFLHNVLFRAVQSAENPEIGEETGRKP